MKILQKSLDLAYSIFPGEFDTKTFHLSFLFDKNRLLGIGQNSLKTHTRNRYNCEYDLGKKGTCSELNLFLGLKNRNIDWKRSSLVNVRIDRNNKTAIAKPCDSCINLIKYLGIRIIYYTVEGEKYEKVVA